MSEVFNLVNLKGGVGKTVSTINIAYSMSAMGKSVLIIDTDNQGNILTALGRNPNLNVGIFITKYQSNANICKAILEKTREMYGESVKVFDTPVPYSVRAAEQTLYGKSIVELMPKHKISAAYTQIAKELIGYDR